ncbi:MAG: phospho-sugar mutase [Christensenellaceae bacterium]|jgi:phosphoglucomutase|nr:phospho-sugar mutase [Christensenellaceae bacterium]
MQEPRREYERWLREFAADTDLKKELLAIAKDEAEIRSRFGEGLRFGTAGLRGRLGFGPARMNAYVVRRATQGLADCLLAGGDAAAGVAIAYDSRRFSRLFAEETARVLCGNGIRAYLFPHLAPVPLLSFAVRALGCAAGVVITASHNPKEYNGYKVYGRDGGQLPPEEAEAIFRAIEGHPYGEGRRMELEQAEGEGLLCYIAQELEDAYAEKVKALSLSPGLCRQMGAELPIVYSPLNGTGNVPLRRVLGEMGFMKLYVVPEQENPDPDFSTVGAAPNPEKPEAYALARALAERVGAKLVLATDPDADRLGCLAQDKQGEFHVLTGNQIGCLLLNHILSSRSAAGTLPPNGAVVQSLVSTKMPEKIAARYGAQVFEVLTGFKFIAEKIEEFEKSGEYAFLFGFEESYGYLAGSFVRDKDAVAAALLLAETAAAYAREGLSLWEGLQALYAEYGHFAERTVSKEMRQGEEGRQAVAAIMAALRAEPPKALGGRAVLARRDYLSCLRTQSAPQGGEKGEERLKMPPSDVLYYEMEGAWACVRPSGTEPLIKFYAGASAKGQAEAEGLVAAILRDLSE